uniref:Helix-turn-helix domain-containing protein n=1 Tax=Streptomyces sp. NBC_01401 TaxID=2903854 RepID=A0AAU3H7G7_9ACTN
MKFEIRENWGRPTGKGMARERATYSLLMEQGYSTREAARIVGINLRTGKR